MIHPTRTTQTRKGAVSRKTKTKRRRKKQYDRGMEMGGSMKSYDDKGIYFRGRGTR